MKTPAWRWTFSHQILALVTVSILAAALAGSIVAFNMPPRPLPPAPMEQIFGRIRDAMHLMQGRQGLDAMLEARAASDRRLTFNLTDNPPPALTDPFALRIAGFVAERLGLPADAVRVVESGQWPGRARFAERPPPGPPPDDRLPGAAPTPEGRVFVPEGRGGGFRRGGFLGRRALAIRLDGRWLLVRGPQPSEDALWLRQAGLTFTLTLAALLLPALWMAHRTARRIRAFAAGADRFGRNPDAPLLPEEGPYELRQAVGAFNRMQSRIQRLVSDRTMMMAAVSHDLRTPLARVRFRIQELEAPVRDAIAEDILQMDELIGQLLSFTREAQPGAERRRFDLSALAQSLVDDLADAGADVMFEGPPRLTVEANLAAVRRVLGNLLDNAITYAGHARLRLEQTGDMVLAVVEDSGPGVPESMREAVFEPFRRLEPSRNRRTGGVGLGLAIARNLARGHGGDIALESAAPAGARFVFSLPLR